jgi:HEPN domain-containing protein
MTENNKRPEETPAEWYRYADENRQVAERELTYKDPAAHTVCFLCQSAAEKYLKGYLIAHGWELERTHDIVRLLELCVEHEQAFQELVSEGAVLNEYITEGRYPGDIAYEDIGREDAEEALDIVRRIRAIITQETGA